MAAPEKLTPVIERLRQLIAQCSELRQRSRALSKETSRMIEATERRIAECVERLPEEDRPAALKLLEERRIKRR